jgi:hypothetical protein
LRLRPCTAAAFLIIGAPFSAEASNQVFGRVTELRSEVLTSAQGMSAVADRKVAATIARLTISFAVLLSLDYASMCEGNTPCPLI